jgi:transaldolase/glucose-6-phosphate isomerase
MKDPLLHLINQGQSYWLDDLTREMIENGTLERRVREEGLRGITSNPSIFHKAITQGQAYEQQIASLVKEGLPVERIYERLVVDDVRRACDILTPVFHSSDGVDGFVSLEVSPHLIHDTAATIAETRRLFGEVDRPNLFIKIPGSPAGVPAIEEMLYEGVNINITLLFSITAYESVAEAYLRALERRAVEDKPLKTVASVASFFVSRIDVLVDQLLSQRILSAPAPDRGVGAQELFGQAAVANARLAYQSFLRIFSGERWERLAARGARVQRVLWASTSTKDPLYSDVRYVEPLIGRHTVNTMPERTIAAFADHGTVRADSVTECVEEARRVMEKLRVLGLDFEHVTWQLLNEGAEKFVRPYNALMATLAERRAVILGLQPGGLAASGGAAGEDVGDALSSLEERKYARRLHAKNTSLWTDDPEVARKIADRLGWLHCVETYGPRVAELIDFASAVKDEGTRHIVLLGMGGSSLCPEVNHLVFGAAPGFPRLTVLDNTDPAAVEAVEDEIDLDHALFIVASKSGTTTETLSFYNHFWERAEAREMVGVGRHFVAITDRGTPLAEEARSRGFRRVFENAEDIGGRYSALSYFGLAPAALIGIDVRALLSRAGRMAISCSAALPAGSNPGIRLGAILGVLARAGRDKVTFVVTEELAPFAAWAEQLLAESSGKDGKGLLPVEGEALGPPSVYGPDRVFVAVQLEGIPSRPIERRLAALERKGHPVVRLKLSDRLDLGGEYFRWEVATATAGMILGVNAFDEPNVSESKRNTRDLLAEWGKERTFPSEPTLVEADGISVFGDAHDARGVGSPLDALVALLDTAEAGDYVALLAYLQRTPARHEALQALRLTIRDRWRVATTLGYGPRYLHSTGQLHKGGPNTGIFVMLTADARGGRPIPGEPYDFATLQRAQALGDYRSLVQHGRRVLRIHLGENVEGALATLSLLGGSRRRG